jgi:phage tail-like protein
MATRTDPYKAFTFLVEIDGMTSAGFMECSGLDTSQDVISYREGSEALTARKLAGLNQYTAITLKRGITDNSELWDWRQKAMDGAVERKSGSIVQLDEAGAEKLRWNFREGWPSKWTGATYNATGQDVAVETLEITHEGITRG